MVPAIYLVSAATNLLCSVLLLAAHRRARKRLLLWSGLCFAGLALAGALVFVDLVLLPNVDLYPLRLGVSLVAMAMLIYGLIWGER